jgi:hypothetical protein
MDDQLMISIFVGIVLFIPLLFCLCRLWGSPSCYFKKKYKNLLSILFFSEYLEMVSIDIILLNI